MGKKKDELIEKLREENAALQDRIKMLESRIFSLSDRLDKR